MGAGVLKSHHPCFLVYFAPFGLAIFSLRLAMVLKPCRAAAFITTICLSSPAASADAKFKIAPSTVNAKQ
jgi:hypothetical protein